MNQDEFRRTKEQLRVRLQDRKPEDRVWYLIGYVGGNDEQSFTGKQLRELFDLVKEGG